MRGGRYRGREALMCELYINCPQLPLPRPQLEIQPSPDWESNQRPFSWQATLNLLSHTSQS